MAPKHQGKGQKMRGLIAAIYMSALTACAHAPAAPDACVMAAGATRDAPVRVPFEIVGGRVYVQTQVNGGGPYRFAVDTGASGMGRVDASLATALHLQVIGVAQSSDGVTTADVNTVHLGSVAIGDLRRADLDLIMRDYSSSVPPEAAISGILGRDFFSDGLLVLDFPARTLSFTRSSGLAPGDANALAYERPFRVAAQIGDLPVTANLDTGAAVTLVLPQTTYAKIEASPLEAAGRARLTNGAVDTSRTIVHGPVVVGAASASGVEARVSNHYPEVLIGGQILQNYVVAIDQRSRLVAVCAPNLSR